MELESTLTTGTVYSNNIRGSHTGKQDDVRQSVGLEASIAETRQYMEASANFVVDHERYLNDTFGGDTSLNGGVGLLNFDLIESLVNWETTFSRDMVLRDASESDNPENRESRDLLRSGPTLNLRLTDTSALVVGGRYINVENSDPEVSDSVRGEATAGLQYDYSRITRLSLNTLFEKILDEDELQKYRRRNINVGVSRSFAGGTGSLNVGRTRLEPESGMATDGNFFNARFTRENVLDHTLTFSYSQDVSDASLGLYESYSLQPELATDGSNELMTQKYFSASASRRIGESGYELVISQNRSTYELSPGGEKAQIASARYTQGLTEHWDTGASFTFIEHQIIGNDNRGIDRTKRYTVNTDYDVTEKLGVGTFVSFISQDNTQQKIRNYEEFQLGVDLRYRL